MKRLLALLIFCIILSTCLTGFAVDALRADAYFDYATTTLSSTKKVTFDAATYDISGTITVPAVRLEQQVGGVWKDIKALPQPTLIEYDSIGYYITVDYSKYIGTGTFRIKTTWKADNHTIVRYSNTRTF